ncbi:MAG TPA: GtrA family protein [Stellaceae bacterium]|nr:GtrA family protein [Stellaceae bacterium]
MTPTFETLTTRWREPAGELMRFAMVGVIGLLVNMAAVRLYLVAFGDRPFSAAIAAWPVAVTTTWWFNRQFTFRGHVRAPMLRQWAQFVVVNLSGAAASISTYEIMVLSIPLCRHFPEIGVAAGAVAGLIFNYTFSQRYVFRR